MLNFNLFQIQKTSDYSVAEKQDFKVRLANVKLKDVDLWTKENLSENGWLFAPKHKQTQ